MFSKNDLIIDKKSMRKYQSVNKYLFLIPATLMVLFFHACNYYHGPASGHFDGSRFHNTPSNEHSLGDMIKWLWEMDTKEWPSWIEDSTQQAPPERVPDGQLRVTYINHATTLIQTDSLNILTDPVWSDYVGPISWLSPKRIRRPGISFDSLPPIDIVLISHDHFDHLDLTTLARLCVRDTPLVITGLGVSERLGSIDDAVIKELDWWEQHNYKHTTVNIHFVPTYHHSGRGLFDADKTLWGGFVIESAHGNVLFIGDSAYDTLFHSIRKKYAPFRLTIFPVGNYEARWFMKNQHMNPEEAVLLHRQLHSRQSIGIHYASFKEHPEQTIDAHEKDLSEALKKHHVPIDEFRLLRFGEGIFITK